MEAAEFLCPVYCTSTDSQYIQIQKVMLSQIQRQHCLQMCIHGQLCFGWHMVIRLLANLGPEIIIILH